MKEFKEFMLTYGFITLLMFFGWGWIFYMLIVVIPK